MAIIEIDGKTFEVENGKMIIEVADDAGIYIPRFCYHKKLSIAANCRMCLVEVENSRKPVPACATPIANGMKVFTKSAEAIRSQQAVMEFLLINHPLDCPICDQGGECELQDVSMGFGYDSSEYEDTKRAVTNDNLGPLIATDMTRCIHCTRCVRFGEEIAGLPELGATGRGEATEIGTYVQHSMRSEVSGNIIDLCPVGALTSKPFRFRARAWELQQYDSIAPHDCLGSNVYLHVRNNILMRVVPRENERINETWLSDRDRFSYLGLQSEARCNQPKIKKNGQWLVVDWPTALKFAAEGISRIIKQHGPEQFGAFAHASSTLEEFYLLQKMMRLLGVNNVDHRLQQTDFRDQNQQTMMPVSNLSLAELEKQNSILLLGCNIVREAPLVGVRVRKAFRRGATVYAINPVDYDNHFAIAGKVIVSPQDLPVQLAKLILAMTKDVCQLPTELQTLLIGIEPDAMSFTIAKALQQPNAAIVTGAFIENHPDAALLRSLIYCLEQASSLHVLRLTTGANSAGACIAGMLPHRAAAGKLVEPAGKDVQQALDHKLRGYLLLAADPNFDFANPYRTRQSMLGAEFVLSLSAFEHESMHDYADVILPIAPYAETSGTYINVNGRWQSVRGVKTPHGEARPAWKILRVLANLLSIKGFDYGSSEDVLTELKALIAIAPEQQYQPFYLDTLPEANQCMTRIGEWPLYRCDALVRYTHELQNCAAAELAYIRINPITANRLKLDEVVTVSQGDIEITLPLKRDERIAIDTVWVPNAIPETVDLGHSFSAITIKR